MPIAGFGQTNDASALFAGLYNQYLSETERDANVLESKNKERQAAKDSETFDKFNQGQLSGAELLAYIRQRQADSKFDPTEKAKWDNAYRDYSNSINDQNAEDAYAQSGDVHALINYYQGRKTGLEKGSPEYSQVSQRLFDLIDKAASDDLYQGAQRIQDNIDHGKATYADLAAFYKRSMGSLRPGSTIKDDVQKAYDGVKETIFKQGVATNIQTIDNKFANHEISGTEANRQLLAAASSFKTSDPAQYQQYIEAGQRYIQSDASSKAATSIAQIDYLFNTGQIDNQTANSRIIAAAAGVKAFDPQQYFQYLDHGQSVLQSNNGTSIPNLSALAGYGASSSYTPPTGTPGGSSPGNYKLPASSGNTPAAAQAFVSAAAQLLGTPYRMGAENTSKTDCSGLVFQAFERAGLGSIIDDKRLLAQGYTNFFANKGDFTRDISEAQRGDLVIYGDGGRATHIGIYLGDNKVMSALTTTGVTVTHVNTLNVQLKGFLLVDWSKAPAGFGVPPPPRKAKNPGNPNGNLPNAPDNTPDSGDVRNTGKDVPQTVDVPSTSGTKASAPSQTDQSGNPRPYNLPLPQTQQDIQAQQDALQLYRGAATDNSDAFSRGAMVDANGNPLSSASVAQANKDALSAIDYEQALNFAMNDPDAVGKAEADRAKLSGDLLTLGDQRGSYLFNRMLSGAQKEVDWQDTYQSDPAAFQRAIQGIAARFNSFGSTHAASLGDVTDPNGTSSQFYQTVVKPVVDAFNAAADPKTNPNDLAAMAADLPSGLLGTPDNPGVLLKIHNTALANQGLADGTLIRTVTPSGFSVAPAIEQTNPDGSTSQVPDPNSTQPGTQYTPFLVDGKVVWALAGQTKQPNTNYITLAADDAASVIASRVSASATMTLAGGANVNVRQWIADNLGQKGAVVPSDVLKAIGRDGFNQLQSQGVFTTNQTTLNTIVIPEHHWSYTDTHSNLARQVAPEDGVSVNNQLVTAQTWVQDPDQLTWFRGELPRKALPDPTVPGAISMTADSTGAVGPTFNYSPDRGVAFPSEGDQRANQKVINSGVLNIFLPAGVGRDSNGNLVAIPPGTDTSTSLGGPPPVMMPSHGTALSSTPTSPTPTAQPGYQPQAPTAPIDLNASMVSFMGQAGPGPLGTLLSLVHGLGVKVPAQAPAAPSYTPPTPVPAATRDMDKSVTTFTPPKVTLAKISVPDAGLNTSRNSKYANATTESYTPPPPINNAGTRFGGSGLL